MAEYGVSPSSFGGSPAGGVSPDINSLLGTSTSQGKSQSLDPAKMQQIAALLGDTSKRAAKPPGMTAAPPGAGAGGSPGMEGFGPPSFAGLLDRLVRYKGTV